MYEDQTYEEILDRSLERVSTDVDKSEGSVIMNAVAPTSAEHAQIYIELDGILTNGYADTAIREWLIKRCKERGIVPEEATYATLKGEFDVDVPIGARFSLDELNYAVTELISLTSGIYSYQLKCETAGTEGNKYFGDLSPITYIGNPTVCRLTELLIPAEDEEDTEVLRARYYASFNSNPYGGNKQDYITKTNSIAGVGSTKVIPVWDGGGTVKLVIIDSDFNSATSTLIDSVQDIIDPIGYQGQGVGVAPIGHTVTVVSVRNVSVVIKTTITFNEGYSWGTLGTAITEAIEAYFLEMRKDWANQEYLMVRISQIETRLLKITGILDVTGTKINGAETNLALEYDQVPVLGGISA
jgi:uncharacterized phage protein gp47/JayE